MFDLKPPVPKPIITMARQKAASAPLGCAMTGGMDEMTRMVWPTRVIATETAIVLNRPHFSSAMYAPRRGVT